MGNGTPQVQLTNIIESSIEKCDFPAPRAGYVGVYMMMYVVCVLQDSYWVVAKLHKRSGQPRVLAHPVP